MIREWEVWCPDEGEERSDALIVVGGDAEKAAIEWGEADDWKSDYRLSEGEEVEVLVAECGQEEAQRFVVTGEISTTYFAKEVEP